MAVSAAAVAVGLAAMMLFTWTVSGDAGADATQCSDQLVGMATCLPYAQGTAKSPTPDCCSGLKNVLAKSPKCLCILIKDRNDPQLGLDLNLTRALSLPSVCHTPANISRCPELLNLPPNSKDARIFQQFGTNSTAAAHGSTTTSTPAGNSSTTAPSNSHANSEHGKSHYVRGMEMVGGLFLLLLLIP